MSASASRLPHLSASLLAALNLKAVVSTSTLQKGLAYYNQGRARVITCEGPRATLKVRGSQPAPYTVHAEALDGGFVTFDCDCPVFHPEAPCKHIVASVHALKDHLTRNPPVTWETLLTGALRPSTPQNRKAATRASRSLLFFSLQKRVQRWSLFLYSIPGSRFPQEAFDPQLDRERLFRTIKGEGLGERSTAVRTFDPARFVGLTDSVALAARMTALLQASTFYYGYYGGQPAGMEQVLPLLEDALVYSGNEQNPLKLPLSVHTTPRAAALELTEKPDGLHIQPVLTAGEETVVLDSRQATFLTESPPWLLIGKDIYGLDGAPGPFLSLASRDPIVVPPAERDLFFERYLTPLAEQMPLRGEGVALEDPPPAAPRPRLYLSEDTQDDKPGSLRAQLRFGYDSEEFPYNADLPDVSLYYDTESAVLRKVRRDPEAEQFNWERLSEFSLKRDVESGWFILRARTDPLDFLLKQVPRLTEVGYEIFGEENLVSLKVNRKPPTLRMSVSSGIDWFDLEAVVQFGEVEAALKDVRRALRKKERYIKLADGSIGMIPDEWVERYRFLFGLGEEEGDKLRLSRHHALLIEEALSGADTFEADAEFERRKERLRLFRQIEPRSLPEGLQIQLYPYQKAGYDWLHFLHQYEFGGCLADDMGLGKTAMTIAFLLSLQQSREATAPDLIVLPRSLIFNWQREAAKFAPSLRILAWDGVGRTRDMAEFSDYDLILTTYRIMLNEIETLRQFRFHYAVLDEAQAIKNPMSQTARAARLLNSDHRLTLTGTPVENAAHELWSQYAFLCPGMLGGFEQFREQFGGAIEKDQDENAATALRRLVQPFLLRRTKEQVAPELPPRTEEIQMVEMEAAQRKAYNRLRDQYRSDILGLLGDGPVTGRNQMKVLEALLRLRQICCHPRLVDPEFKGESAKLSALLEMLETLAAEKHKALIFSQFTQVLALVRAELDARRLPYAYLDGRTRNREAHVDTFQNDPSIPFFLISLKAGGFGLNLTAADYVLHIDPWWNPAAEQQATDRAHRIGQDKPVFVYKFIARDSVEEKILELQERKRSLANQLITTEAGMLKSLTREDLAALFE